MPSILTSDTPISDHFPPKQRIHRQPILHPLSIFGNPPTPLAAASGSTIPNRLEQSSNILNAFLARIREISVEPLVGLGVAGVAALPAGW